MSTATTTTAVEAIYELVEQYKKRDYFKSLRLLVKNVNYVLKTNPHNTFTGTAFDYIRQYNLHINLKNKIDKHWTI